MLSPGVTQATTSKAAFDDVYPLHVLDDTKTLRQSFPCYLFRFNDVLDAEKLSSSLERLLEIGDWRKLGGRLKLKVDGRLEIVVPSHYTPERPALAFSEDVLDDSNIEDHWLGRQLPNPSHSELVVQNLSSDLRSLAGSFGSSRTIKRTVQEQTPILTLHVTVFKNATVVVLTWPHVVMDAMGAKALLRNWSSILNGKEEEVSAVISVREDVLEQGLSERILPDEKLMVGEKTLTTLRLIIFVLRILWQNLFGAGFEERTLFLEEQQFNELKSRAQQDLLSSQEAGEKRPFISDGDVIAAWMIRSMALSQHSSSPIAFLGIFNAQFRLSLLQSHPIAAYIQNFSLTSSFTFSNSIAKGPLGDVALSHRMHMAEQSTEQQTWSFIRAQREHIQATRDYKNYLKDPLATPLLFNNLSKIGILQATNFAAAVVKRDGGDTSSRKNPLGTALYFTPLPRSLDPFFKINQVYVLGKDSAGRYQITALLRRQMWAVIERESRSGYSH